MIHDGIAAAASHRGTEHTLRLRDGTELFYRAWMPSARASKALILFHRGHEHSARWQQTVESLALDDVAVFAWDARGHGRSPGERGAADSLATIIRDADDFVRQIASRHGIRQEDMIVIAHSVGAVVASAWVHDYAPPIRGIVLATPAFRVKLYVPFAVPLLRLRQKLFGPGSVKSYVKAKMLTHDPEQAALYHADEFIFRQISVNILLDLHDTSTRLLKDAGAIAVPTLILGAGADWVVKLSTQRRFFESLSSPVKDMKVFPTFYHAVFHEKDRNQAIQPVRQFIQERFKDPSGPVSLLDADESGFTKREYDGLRRPGGIAYSLPRAGMKTIGRLSRGIQLGWRTGFDSGASLDYVYENRPQGITPLGVYLDRAYLESIGWKGIRQRKVHLSRLLLDSIDQMHAAGKPVSIIDVAAGHGRYVLETVARRPHVPLTVLLRDRDSANLEAARKRAERLGLAQVRTTQADAFDPGSYAGIEPRPTIAIVSGLYELFPSNELVMRSLRGLSSALVPGGLLIYTNQPWHPQVEFIARVLTNRDGDRWIMRRRTQAEMDQLVRSAGFLKLSQEIDTWGIFSVSLARRIAA